MESTLKQRLVGAIVLVALAVIFLPMLLDGSGQSGPRDVAIDIPEQPQPPRDRLAQPEASAPDNADAAASAGTDPSSGSDSQPGTRTEEPLAADDRAGSTAEAEQPPPVDADPAQSEDATDSDAAESGSEGSPATDETDTETAAAEAEPAGTDSSGTSESEAAASAAEDSDPTSWVVQVGSFGRETNALVLRDRLRELGFDAFVERGETDQGAVWRVRVGPVASRDAADRLSERVTEERGGPALVMTHP